MKMKKAILLCGMLLAIATSAATAGGLGLRWTNCEGDGGVQNLNFACNLNTGNRTLAASFTLDSDLLDVLSDELVLDVATASPTLVAWWELRGTAANACRVVAATNAQALTIAAQDGASCPDIFAGSGSMNIASYAVGVNGPNKARVLSVNAVPSTSPVPLSLVDNPSGTWGVARFTITNQKTLGTPSCAGCDIAACIVFNSCNITTVGNAFNRLVSGPAQPGSDYATWQGGGGAGNCPGATPTRNATWGKVKGLYR
jgi:hypothetical protein